MYTFLTKKEKAGSLQVYGDYIFLRTTENKQKTSVLYQLDKRFKVLWRSPENKVYACKIIAGNLLYTLQDPNDRTLAIQLISRPIKDLSIVNYQREITTHLFEKTVSKNKLVQINKNESELQLYNLDTGEIEKVFPIGNSVGISFSLQQNKIIKRLNRSSVIEVFDLDYTKLWQYDFSEECKYIDSWNNKEYSGSARHIYAYQNDKIIVCCKDSYSFCFDLNSGEQVWKNDYNSEMVFDFDNNIGYSYSNGGSLAKIDLQTGNNLNKEGKHFHLPDLPEFNDCHIGPHLNYITYHQGLLWGLVYSNGYSFILAINQHDWHYEWIHRVETRGKLLKLQFHQNYMYLKDSEGNLFVYEKEC